MADRTIAWTVESLSRASWRRSRFIDLGMRTANITTSSASLFFLVVGTAGPSLAYGQSNRRRLLNVLRLLQSGAAADASIELCLHDQKWLRSPRSLWLPGISPVDSKWRNLVAMATVPMVAGYRCSHDLVSHFDVNSAFDSRRLAEVVPARLCVAITLRIRRLFIALCEAARNAENSADWRV